MYWKKESKCCFAMSERLVEAGDGQHNGRVPKGYVPVLVGSDGRPLERFLVPLRSLKDPCIQSLLDMAAQEFGYRQQGILRIPCDTDHFRRVVDLHVHSKSR